MSSKKKTKKRHCFSNYIDFYFATMTAVVCLVKHRSATREAVSLTSAGPIQCL